MKKVCLALLMTILFMPIMTYASVLNEMPPYINIEGINEKEYDVTKTITKDTVIVELTNKKTKLYYSWSFDKNKLEDNITLNFNIDFESKNEEKIDKLVGNSIKKYISFAYHGKIPENTKIKVYVLDKYKNGDILKLYYYNEETNKAEFIQDNIIVKDGYAEFEIDHCSEYFLIGNVAIPKKISKNMNYVIVGLVIAVIILLGYTMFVKR